MRTRSTVDVERLRTMWDEGESVSDIASALGLNPSMVYKVAVENGFTRRAPGGKAKADPTIEEIYSAAAAIRATWPAERLAQSRSGGWTPPKV